MPFCCNSWISRLCLGGYLFGTLAHEIGHLFFGFGLTRERIEKTEELWFSLGLGMLYDMKFTEQLIGRKPQLEIDFLDNWQTRYFNLPDIDQRLIHPDTNGDKKYPFDRKKVFAHGKAAYYLGKVRDAVGDRRFDDAVVQYVQHCGDCVNGYDDFKKFLSKEDAVIQTLEIKHGIR